MCVVLLVVFYINLACQNGKITGNPRNGVNSTTFGKIIKLPGLEQSITVLYYRSCLYNDHASKFLFISVVEAKAPKAQWPVRS